MVKIRCIRGGLALLALVLAPLLASPHARAEQSAPLTVFAAASLAQAIEAAVADWPGTVRISVGGSGGIARQVAQGAPADVVMLANSNWMDWLERGGHIRTQTRRAPIGNQLVLVGPPGAPPLAEVSAAALMARLGPAGRIAMGDHRAVPAGQYAQDWLQARGLWTQLQPRLAETENVRAALALVARGEVPLAFVYASDLVTLPDVASPVWTIPPDQQPVIRYELAAVTPAGDTLAAYLAGDVARAAFLRLGFSEAAP